MVGDHMGIPRTVVFLHRAYAPLPVQPGSGMHHDSQSETYFEEHVSRRVDERETSSTVKEMVTTESVITVRSNKIPLVHVLILIFLTLNFLEALLLLSDGHVEF
jgi:hypothetical protein